MAYELSYTNLEQPLGKEVSLSGLGITVKNGEPILIDDDVADAYKNRTGKTVFEGYNHRGDFSVKVVKSDTSNEGVS